MVILTQSWFPRFPIFEKYLHKQMNYLDMFKSIHFKTIMFLNNLFKTLKIPLLQQSKNVKTIACFAKKEKQVLFIINN